MNSYHVIDLVLIWHRFARGTSRKFVTSHLPEVIGEPFGTG